MDIVFPVTAYTHPGCFLRKHRSGMTLFTFYLFMFVQKRIGGLLEMVKIFSFPGFCRMTDFAFLSKKSLMFVIFLVTINTEFWGVSKELRLMAKSALGINMLSLQREITLLVIEFSDLFPRFFRMTFCARFAKFSFMFIIFLMTGDTIGRDLIFLVGMAFVAGHGNMLAQQRIFCRGMIEFDLFPLRGNLMTPIAFRP
jgi:hypothetical protein